MRGGEYGDICSCDKGLGGVECWDGESRKLERCSIAFVIGPFGRENKFVDKLANILLSLATPSRKCSSEEELWANDFRNSCETVKHLPFSSLPYIH